MSRLLALATLADGAIIYRFVRKLARSHGGLAVDFTNNEARFLRNFEHGAFRVHLYREDAFEVGGIALHMTEYSLDKGTYGCYLDDFYLDEALRGRGLGRRMLGELCDYLLNNDQYYLKVVFHESLNLDKMYKHFGFINQTESCGLRLYEGNSGDLRNILKCDKGGLNDQNICVFENVKFSDNEVKNKPLSAYRVVLIRAGRRCQFCCQFYFNSWVSYGLLFSDFSGDTEIVQLQDFRYAALRMMKDVSWSPECIRCIWWHIFRDQKNLGKCIKSCEAEDISNDGWIISCLEKEGMSALAASVR